MALVTSTLSHTGHRSVRRNEGRHNNNKVTLHLSSSSTQSKVLGYHLIAPFIATKTSYNISHRSRAARISNDLGAPPPPPAQPIITKKSFPEGFVFGAATSSYQIEGAWDSEGKGPSVWDHYCHRYPGKITGRSNGDVAVNSYHLYTQDVEMLSKMGMNGYRFSICWPRILPKGTVEGGINQQGIDYYNNLINLLIQKGIEPYVTLFHWEIPQALEEEYGSFRSQRIVYDFKEFAKVCFDHFGDRVKHWFTFNEPYVFCCNAYGTGRHAPGRCSPGEECAVPDGDSLVEPYIAGHNLLLAHAEAVHLYRDHPTRGDDGKIGMALVSMGYEPFNTAEFVDPQAQQRSIDYNLGWFLEPMVRGDYPFSMRSLVGDRLPFFTEQQQNRITGAYDMMGLNYYTSRFSANINISPSYEPVLNTQDAYAEVTTHGPNGEPIGPNTGTEWLYSDPEGLKNLLMIIKNKYGNPPVYITENGVGDIDDGTLSPEVAKNDTTRLKYLQEHIAIVKESIDEGAKVRGHFTWSLLDNFEWQNGFTHRFGLIYVDHTKGFERSMKKSARWFRDFNQYQSLVIKIGPFGGSGGEPQDITETPVRLESVTVQSGVVIDAIAFSYTDQAGQTRIAGPWGGSGRSSQTIELAPNEFVKGISGTVGRYQSSNVIASLTFVTNVNTYGPFGLGDGTPFTIPIEDKNCVVGFFARSKTFLEAIGVYVQPQ